MKAPALKRRRSKIKIKIHVISATAKHVAEGIVLKSAVTATVMMSAMHSTVTQRPPVTSTTTTRHTSVGSTQSSIERLSKLAHLLILLAVLLEVSTLGAAHPWSSRSAASEKSSNSSRNTDSR